MGTKVVGESNSVEYSTPLKIVEPLIKEFGLVKDVCASSLNHKLPDYWTKEDNALAQFWQGNCWMNPPLHIHLVMCRCGLSTDKLYSEN